MIIDEELFSFVKTHADDDTTQLMLSAHRYPDIDMRMAVSQIEARKQIKNKLPEWYACERLLMSGRVPAEQCSSEQTAKYKQSIIDRAQTMCDMTGGMGVDLYYMSSGMSKVYYTEQNPMLCDNARHNFAVLGRDVEIRCGDGRELPIPNVDLIYIDPARRSTDGKRVYAIDDCEPNILPWQDTLMLHCQTLLVKLSPMIDLTDTLRRVKNVSEVHIVAVRNECKEILLKCVREPIDAVTIHCVDFLASSTMRYTFTPNKDEEVRVVSAGAEIDHLYEPDATLMKAQAFASLCSSYDVAQLDRNTRLMTSPHPIDDFPGRTFTVHEIISFSSKTLKQIKKTIPQANISTRNFPLTADELRKRTSIKDGGDIYIFGATVRGNKMLLVCKKR